MKNPNTSLKTAVVIGGSLGGLFAANLLYRAGWDVHVYERASEELDGRGAGIVTHPELMDVLEAAGVGVDHTLGVSVQERVTLAKDGTVAGRRPMAQLLTAWSRLYSVLKVAFPAERYHNGMQLTSFEDEGAQVVAEFSGGIRLDADVLIAADGIRSSVRSKLLPETKPLYAGYVAWRGLVEERALSERAQREIFPYFSFGLPPREQFIAYPVAGGNNSCAPGERRFNFVWYRPADEDTLLKQMLTDAEGRFWADGIPPPLIRSEIVEKARSDAREVLAPQFAEAVEKAKGLFFQPIFDVESPQLAFGRVALLGDAAFVARPHCGMGVTKAASDALALVQALDANSDVSAALRTYEQQRLRVGSFIVEHARALGAYMQAQLHSERERLMAEAYRTVDAVMRETAVAPALP